MNAEMMLHVILTGNRLHSQADLQRTNAETCIAIYNVRSRILMAITEVIQTDLASLSRGLEIATNIRDRQIISLQGMLPLQGTQPLQGMRLLLGMLCHLETISSHREAYNLLEVRNHQEA
mgnify:CR=1 FL=1